MKYLLSEEEIKALVSRIELHMAEVTDPTPPDEQDAAEALYRDISAAAADDWDCHHSPHDWDWLSEDEKQQVRGLINAALRRAEVEGAVGELRSLYRVMQAAPNRDWEPWLQDLFCMIRSKADRLEREAREESDD